MLEIEQSLVDKLRRRDAIPTGGVPRPPDRMRFVSSLHAKAASAVPSEPERVRQAEAQMRANRDEARQQLLSGPPSSHPMAHRGIGPLVRAAAEQRAAVLQEREEARGWRAAAVAQEQRRRRYVATRPDGGPIGNPEAALAKIARRWGP